MPIDVDLAKELAEKLSADPAAGMPVSFSYDPFADQTDIGEQPFATIALATFETERQNRSEWNRTVGLLLTMLVRQPPNLNAAFFTTNLARFDAMVEVLKADARIDSIDQPQRFAFQESQTAARLVCQAVISMSYQ